jgi:hypothetical protein
MDFKTIEQSIEQNNSHFFAQISRYETAETNFVFSSATQDPFKRLHEYIRGILITQA